MALSRPYDWDTEFVCNECNQILSNDVMRKYTVFDEYMGFFVVEKLCIQCDEKNENAEINGATIQGGELADNSYNTEVEERIIKVTMDEESEPICNEVMEPLEQIPLDKNCLLLDMQEPTMNETITYYDAVMEPTHYYLENMDQNNENYSDPLSHEDKNVLPMDSEYYLGVKKKTQQRIGRQVSFNLLTSQVLGYNEPCQWKQRNSTHMGPVHCVNRKRKKKRTSQGLSRIELQHVKRKNLQPSFNLMRMLIKYII